MIGRVVGKYKILDQIGEGGMGTVYRAEHVMLGSTAAIKILLPRFTSDPMVLERFFNEAKTASAIKHAGITAVFDFGRMPNHGAFIVQELLRGEDLTAFLGRHGRLIPSLAVEIISQLLHALNAAHATGVVHRDLKPDNIYLVRDTSVRGGIRVKVLDFGIAKLMPDHHGEGTTKTGRAKTKSGAILGTPAYMAPEQCRGGIEVDARADIYAAGCILFELLTGRPPFWAEGDGEIMAMHIYQPVPKLSEHGTFPADLEALVLKMMTKAPDDRAPSAAWALAALERLDLPPLDAAPIALATSSTPALAAGTPLPIVHTDEPREKLPAWIPIVVIVVALLIAGAAIYFIGLDTPDLPE